MAEKNNCAKNIKPNKNIGNVLKVENSLVSITFLVN